MANSSELPIGTTRSRLPRTLCILGSFVALVTPALAQLPSSSIKWVNSSTGNNGNNGSMMHPWKTLTHALAQARSNSNITNINFVNTGIPIAPTGFGGSLEPNDCFPMTMVPGVAVAGVDDGNGDPPTMLIDEAGFQGYGWPSWTDPNDATPTSDLNSRNAYIYGASNATLSNFILDNSLYLSNGAETPVGVRAKDVQNFQILGCEVRNMYDGILFDETGTDTNGSPTVDTSLVTSGTVIGCTISDCFPNEDPDTDPVNDRGHSGMWLQVFVDGTGSDDEDRATVEVDASGTIFERNHDAIETNSVDGTTDTLIKFNATNCTFRCNENGLEIVSNGDDTRCDVDLDACNFLNNFNRRGDEGGYQNEPSCAIVHRTKDCNIKVRNSVFRNNAVAIRDGGANLDLGIDEEDPGLNWFMMDVNGGGLPTAFTPCPDPAEAGTYQPAYYVMLLHNGANTVNAYGNRWLASHQGTDSNGWMLNCGASCSLGSSGTTCCSGGGPSTVCSTSPTGVNYGPVTVTVDSTQNPDVEINYDGPAKYADGNGACRNYSIKQGGGEIFFGPDTGSACPGGGSSAAACTGERAVRVVHGIACVQLNRSRGVRQVI